jgi:hypothetical protein
MKPLFLSMVVSVTSRVDPSTRAPALAGASCSGFRPTGILEGATGLPVGIHACAPVPFHQGKTITVIIGYQAGDGSDRPGAPPFFVISFVASE